MVENKMRNGLQYLAGQDYDRNETSWAACGGEYPKTTSQNKSQWRMWLGDIQILINCLAHSYVCSLKIEVYR